MRGRTNLDVGGGCSDIRAKSGGALLRRHHRPPGSAFYSGGVVTSQAWRGGPVCSGDSPTIAARVRSYPGDSQTRRTASGRRKSSPAPTLMLRADRAAHAINEFLFAAETAYSRRHLAEQRPALEKRSF